MLSAQRERLREKAPYPGQLQACKGTLKGEIVCNVARMRLYPCPFSLIYYKEGKRSLLFHPESSYDTHLNHNGGTLNGPESS